MKSGCLHPLLLSCIVTVLVPWSTQALSVRIADTTAEAGASAITVSIEVDNALGIAGGDLTLIYDAAALTAKRVATGSLAAASGLTVIGNTAGAGQVKIAMAGAIGLRSASGVLTTIAFDVSANAIPGTYSLELTRATFFNEQARTISVRHIASGTFTVASKARRGVEVKIENVSGNLGDTGIEVSITVEDGTGLAGADLTLTYEASVLTAKEVTPGSLAAASGFMFTGNTAGPGLVKIAMAGATGIPSGGGALAIVIFDVKADAAPGAYSLNLTRAIFRNEQAQSLSVQPATGLFTILDDVEVPGEGPVSIDFDLAAGNQEQRRAGSATPGSRYAMELSVSSAPEIDGWAVTVEYDAAQVTFVSGSFEASDFLPGIFILLEEDSGVVILGGAVLGTGVTNSGDGSLGTLEFEVLPGFADSTDLVISRVVWKRVDGDEEVISVHSVATITASRVSAGLAGDFDGDGKVGLFDFFLFADAFGGTDLDFDLTGDGKVNLFDFFLFADAYGSSELAKLLAVAEAYLGVPLTAQLAQNYPNPFNSETVIEYELPQSGEIQLVIYDVTGQRVATLASGLRQAGTYALRWDGRDDAGRRLASGVYLYRLEAPAMTGDRMLQTRKLLLLR
jgi:hypothetical protein